MHERERQYRLTSEASGRRGTHTTTGFSSSTATHWERMAKPKLPKTAEKKPVKELDEKEKPVEASAEVESSKPETETHAPPVVQQEEEANGEPAAAPAEAAPSGGPGAAAEEETPSAEGVPPTESAPPAEVTPVEPVPAAEPEIELQPVGSRIIYSKI